MPDPIPFDDTDLAVSAMTLAGEADNQPLECQQAVAWVIRNRASWDPPAWWGSTPAGVCLKPFQFSCNNPPRPGHPNPDYQRIHDMKDDNPDLLRLREVARSVFAGEIDDPTGGSCYYENVGAGASWAKGKEFSVILGKLAFYVLDPEGR